MAPVLASLSVAWLLAGSHCTLFAATLAKQAQHSCCDSKSPATPHKNCSECCQSLTAPVPDAASGLAGFPQDRPAMALTVVPVPVAPRTYAATPESGTSPPGQFFVQVVLGSCLNAQAPPAFVS
jgi:hypothetical protein